MEIFEAIHGRRSVGKVKPDALPREIVEKLLSAGVQAPNHYKVRPWRFVVLTGDGRKKLGDVMAASFADRNPGLPTEALDKPRATPLMAPVVIAVGVDKPSESKVIEMENISAASAACQNILLAAHALGLGAKWKTGEWARDAKVKEFLGFAPDQHIVGFIYVGYPDVLPEPYTRG
ncbi:MAG: nitroreductase, partial [Chloroflexi bacterium]|nr:nitroreductase [Chloroflexota bacterium]